MIQRSLALAATALVLAAAAPLSAQAMSKEMLEQYAKLPDWSGVWKLNGTAALLERGDLKTFAKGNRDHPPYNAEWEARYVANIARAEDQGNQTSANPIIDSHTVYCLAGMPRDIATPFEYQFINSPGVSWILIGGEVRDIFTDGRPLIDPDIIWDKYWGWSRGHWEGETLVVETSHVQTDLWADPTPAVLSTQQVIHERIHRVDANTMQDDVVIEDPVAFVPGGRWTFTRTYHKINEWPDEKEICGGKDDRNPLVGGRVTVQLKK